MHIEFLIEDISGKKMLEILLPKILSGHNVTYAIHPYSGIGGKIPQTLKHSPETAKHRILLDNLPRLLSGYGKTFQSYGKNYQAAVIVVCDLDQKNKVKFEKELYGLLNLCAVRPKAFFCLAIEEGEAWFLGDMNAIRQAYPNGKFALADNYEQDSICGTWEVLADIVCPGGHAKLQQGGFQAVGKEKSVWAEKITPYMDIDHNRSPSFSFFRDTVRLLLE